ncbi:MAG TPA: hypothetical protein VHI10_09165 [Mycobacterium sp.]|nr:hypothetical protein [Mycobacterium sp.]
MRTASRRAAALFIATGATALGLGAQTASTGSMAYADRVVSVHELCNAYKPGYVPMLAGFTLGAVYCSAPGTIPLQGLSDSTEGYVKPGTLPGLPPGSFKVNPFDPFSAWVIPG